MPSTISSVSLSILLVLFLSHQSSSLNYLYTITVDSIEGNDTSSCLLSNNTPCRTLIYALENIYNSTLVSLNGGLHYLNNSVVIENVSHVAVVGKNISVHIICSNSGLEFSTSFGLLIRNIIFIGCGRQLRSRNELSNHLPQQAALAFIQCHNITIDNVTVLDINGTGLLTYECSGVIRCLSTKVIGNHIYHGNNQGALFFFSAPSTQLEVVNCYFINNTLCHSDSEFEYCKGGGMAVIVHNTTNVTVSIKDSAFVRNTASTGGGVYIEYATTTLNSMTTFENCTFVRNIALAENNTNSIYGGGGLAVYYSQLPLSISTGNMVIVNDTWFNNNTANIGGGLYVCKEWSRVLSVAVSPILSLLSSVFGNNEANIGAALAVSMQNTAQEGFLSMVLVEKCNFSQNFVSELTGSSLVGIASIFVSNIKLEFRGQVHICNNTGTAIVLDDSSCAINKESDLLFWGNSGLNGGALALYGQSWLTLDNNTKLSFHYNTAYSQGGAIYYHNYQLPQVGSKGCFLRYSSLYTSLTYALSVSVDFYENKLQNTPNSIYANSISMCTIATNNETTTNEYIFCQSGWQYFPGNCTSEVWTAPVQIESPATSIDVFTGTPTLLPLSICDAFNHNITDATTLKAIAKEGEIIFNPPSGLIANNHIEIYAETDSNTTIMLQISQSPFLHIDLSVNILQCPTGFVPSSQDNIEGNVCVCPENAFFPGIIVCDNNTFTAELTDMHCMSNYNFNNEEIILVAGLCPFLISSSSDSQTFLLPKNRSQVEDDVCGRMNRQGVLCGDCEEGYGLAVYSYGFDCVKCDHTSYGWLLYLLLQYLTVTIFFIVIVVFNLTIISPASNAFLFFSQITANSDSVIFSTLLTESAFGRTIGSIIVKTFFSLYNIWNLDILRAFSPSICLQAQLNTLYVIFLDFISSLYPLLLLLVTYVLIQLYDRNFRVIVWLWKPFQFCMKKYHDKFEPRTSLIDAFASFLVLSYTKILAVSFRLLRNAFVYDIHGNILKTVFYYNGNINMFQGIHLPFGIISLLLLVTIVAAPPILLLFYQFKWFQKLLEKLHLRTHALIAFVEIFQNGFMNRTNSTKDRRFFAGMYFVLRIILFAPVTVSGVLVLMLVIPQFVYSFAVIIFATGQPYKNNFYNKVDIFHFVILLLETFLFFVGFALLSLGQSGAIIGGVVGLAYMLGILPFVYMSCYVGWWFLLKLKLLPAKCLRRDEAEREEPVIKTADISSSLFSAPDRVLQPDLYKSLHIEEECDQEFIDQLQRTSTQYNIHYGSVSGNNDNAHNINNASEICVELSTYSN